MAEEETHARHLKDAAERGDLKAILEQGLAHESRQMESLTTVADYEIVRGVALSNVPMDERLSAFLEGTRTLLGAQVAALLLMDAEQELLWPRASLGFETTLGVRPVAVNGTMRNVIRTGQTVVIAEVEPNAEFRVGLIEEGIHSLVASVVKIEGTNQGVLICGHREGNKFTQKDARLMEIVADQVGLALQVRRRLEVQTRRRRRAENVSDFKTDLLNMATHDVKTPLSTLAMQLHVLARPDSTSEQRSHSVAVMQRSIQRLTAMLDDFVDLARIQADRLTIAPARLDASALLRETVELFAGQAKEAGLRIDLQAPAGLEVLGDERRILQVLANLVSNAIRYSPNAGTIRITTHRAPESVEIHIIDEGSGLTPEQIGRLFQPFVQVHDAPGRTKGSGLGLYLSKSIVSAHGGRLWLASPGPGLGTDAAFTLPVPPKGKARLPATGTGAATP